MLDIIDAIIGGLFLLLATIITVMVARAGRRVEEAKIRLARGDQLYERQIRAVDELAPVFASMIYFATLISHFPQGELEKRKDTIEPALMQLYNRYLEVTAPNYPLLPEKLFERVEEGAATIWNAINELTAFVYGGLVVPEERRMEIGEIVDAERLGLLKAAREFLSVEELGKEFATLGTKPERSSGPVGPFALSKLEVSLNLPFVTGSVTFDAHKDRDR